MTFHPGQRVECHRIFFEGDSELAWSRVRAMGVVLPTVGEKYTVKEAIEQFGIPGLYLWEISNAHLVPLYYAEAPSFPQAWFRPLTERGTDISVFTEMLTSAKDEVPA